MVREWYSRNVNALRKLFGEVHYDEHTLKWVKIRHFKLPSFYNRSVTRLLIETPGVHLYNHDAFNFYADLGLRRPDIESYEHIYEQVSSYNRYAAYGLARLSLHIKTFKPSSDVCKGDNLIDIAQNVYNFFSLRKGL